MAITCEANSKPHVTQNLMHSCNNNTTHMAAGINLPSMSGKKACKPDCM